MPKLTMTRRRKHLYEHALLRASNEGRMTRNDFSFHAVTLGERRQVTKEGRVGDIVLRHVSFYPPRGKVRGTLTILRRGRTVFRVQHRLDVPMPLVDRRGAWEKTVCKEGSSCSWIA